jgi:hypothetical protein
MRTLAAWALAALCCLPAVRAQEPTRLVITELLADPDTNLGQREFVEILNPGEQPVELSGWSLRDAATTSGSVNTFTFPPWTLRPHARVVVWGGGAGDAAGPAWSHGSAWNNLGDAATLLDPAGNVVDWFGFGTAPNPPPGFEGRPVPARAPRGLSLEWDGSEWMAHEPTPGTVPGAASGSLTLEVGNAAPTASFSRWPASARPGAAVPLGLLVDDPNGAADVASWRLLAGNQSLASGTAPPSADVVATAPSFPGAWLLRLEVADHGGLTASAEVAVEVRWSDLVVLMPAGGPLAFPAPAADGTRTTPEPVTLRNVGSSPIVPRIDVSPFRGPARFDAEGRITLGLVRGDHTEWIPYGRALAALPELAPGESVGLLFRLASLPPLPAGSYGTSFTVVA